MGYQSVYERLKIVSELIQRREDLQKYLQLQRKILQIQLKVDEGVKAEWINQLSLEALEKRALEAKKPIIQFLNPAMFDLDSSTLIFKEVVEVFISTYPEKMGLRKLLEQIAVGKQDFKKFLETVLEGDETALRSYTDKGEIEASLLLYLISTTIQPFIEKISQRASQSFNDKWWKGICPVCGRIPNVARIRNRQRYLMCNFCGSEYLSDYFLCVNCENKDPYTLKYLIIEEKPEFQIDYCLRCKHYIKVIIESALKDPIPRCVEDLLTLELDLQAKDKGLIRN